MAGLAVGFGVRIKAVAVVGDAEGEECWSAGELKGDMGGGGVFEGVRDSFMGDHAEMMRDVRRDGGDGTQVEGDGDAFWCAGSDELKGFGECGGVLGVAEVGDDVAGLALDAGDEAAAGFEQVAGFVFKRARGGGIEPQ